MGNVFSSDSLGWPAWGIISGVLLTVVVLSVGLTWCCCFRCSTNASKRREKDTPPSAGPERGESYFMTGVPGNNFSSPSATMASSGKPSGNDYEYPKSLNSSTGCSILNTELSRHKELDMYNSTLPKPQRTIYENPNVGFNTVHGLPVSGRTQAEQMFSNADHGFNTIHGHPHQGMVDNSQFYKPPVQEVFPNNYLSEFRHYGSIHNINTTSPILPNPLPLCRSQSFSHNYHPQAPFQFGREDQTYRTHSPPKSRPPPPPISSMKRPRLPTMPTRPNIPTPQKPSISPCFSNLNISSNSYGVSRNAQKQHGTLKSTPDYENVPSTDDLYESNSDTSNDSVLNQLMTRNAFLRPVTMAMMDVDKKFKLKLKLVLDND
ncbi:unnamed protein product [Meganyctiphanes norvegica]|uniref:Uncharacterized protein n=1 Tax=Meganyctiphanes norvegica TaxID=48144 RepID=A0AAV2QRW9_MEGNR